MIRNEVYQGNYISRIAWIEDSKKLWSYLTEKLGEQQIHWPVYYDISNVVQSTRNYNIISFALVGISPGYLERVIKPGLRDISKQIHRVVEFEMMHQGTSVLFRLHTEEDFRCT